MHTPRKCPGRDLPRAHSTTKLPPRKSSGPQNTAPSPLVGTKDQHLHLGKMLRRLFRDGDTVRNRCPAQTEVGSQRYSPPLRRWSRLARAQLESIPDALCAELPSWARARSVLSAVVIEPPRSWSQFSRTDYHSIAWRARISEFNSKEKDEQTGDH